RIWAVIIGIDAYPGNPLHGCVTDALTMETYLIKNLGVPRRQIQRLISSKYPSSRGSSIGVTNYYSHPTRANIIDTLLGLSTNSNINKGDGIIIFFAGRGSSYYPREHSTTIFGDNSELSPLMSTSVEKWHQCGCPIEALCPIDRNTIGDNGVRIPDISDREMVNILRIIYLSTGAYITLILDCGPRGYRNSGPEHRVGR
ncbi:uncharacterized protein EV420DRAFT_1282625, partial [Desarmillaria tabescens]